jgi:nucleoside-diphosphate-sugar epimerase
MIAVTGASGYVGGLASREFANDGVLRLVRRPVGGNDVGWDFDMPAQALAEKLERKHVTHIIHAAWDMRSSKLDELERTAVAGSLRLLDTARMIGAKVIFISTISAFTGAHSAYGKAKLQIEEATIRHGGIVLRLGLVAGQGGMFDSLRKAIRGSRIVPMIGDGSTPQYLLPQASLLKALRAAVDGRLDNEHGPVTLAIPHTVPFKSILLSLAREAGRDVTLVPVPWRIFHMAFRGAELLRLKTGFRSDSVLSFVYQDPHPDFSHQERLGLTPTWNELQPPLLSH